jgi:multidrug efflux system membrane fusion protein
MRLPNVHLPAKLPLKLVALGAVGVALAGGAFAAFSFNANASRVAAASEPVIRPARVAEITYRKQSQALLLAGTVVPRIESTLGFRVSGKIIQRSVDVGAIVKPGDVIATLDPPTTSSPSTMPAPLSPRPTPTIRAPRPTMSAT